MLATRQVYVTAIEAAPFLGVTPALISKWRSMGKLQTYGKRGRSPLYELSELQQVESDTRNSPYNLKRS